MAEGAPSPAQVYQSIFVPAMLDELTGLSVAAAAPTEGETAVDLACGTGIVARRIAPILGPGGGVIAVDLRPGMLEVARALDPPPGAAVTWRQGDATALDLASGKADLVICQQGLQYFADRPAALAEMRRILRPGGRLVLTVWCNLGELGLMDELVAAEARHLAAFDVTFEDIALPFTAGDPEMLARIVGAAGFDRVAVRRERITARFPSADSLVRDVELPYMAVIGPFLQDPARFEGFVAAVQADVAPALERWRDGAGVSFPMHTWIVTARC